MDETLFTMAVAAALAVGAAVLLRRWGWGIAIPLIALGALVDLVPVGPNAPPDPEFVLVLILAPLVFGEALGSSYLDLRKVSRPVLALAVGLVIATTLVVGGVGAALVSMPLAMAFALGAVLAPTDAVAVSTVARRAGLPRRLVSILEGESLVNDGTGLTALKVSLAAAAAGTVTLLEVSGIFAVAVTVGVVVGAVGGWLFAFVLRHSNDLVAANALVLVAPFLLYAIAEQFEGSGILAVVVAGLVIAHVQNGDPGHTGRVQSVVVWRHITFLLQALAFFLVGLELPDVLRRLDADEQGAVLVLVPVVIVAIIVTRAVFVLLMTAVNRVRSGSVGPSMLKGAVIMSWAGARGPVSGLAAFAIPVTFAAGDEVPFRDVILATTFCVIVVTLLLSFTLAPLSRLIRLPQDDDEALVRRVDAALARAALERLGDLEAEAAAAGTPLPPDLVRLLQEEANRRIERSIETAPAVEQDADARAVTTGRALIRAEQEELIRLRDEEGLPDAIVRPLLRELDIRAQALNSRH
jgi:CPA1 family monovalent cation:H+ antiporter